MENQSLISVCLLVYNQEKLLPDVIRSILDQDYSNYEIIISDDQSTDNSWQIIKEFKKKYPIIRAIQTPYNMGMAANTNYVVSKAKGEYIALLHHDDLAMSNLLSEWYKVIKKDKNIGFVFNDYCIKNYFLINEKQSGNYTCHTVQKRTFLSIMNGCFFLKNHMFDRFASPVRGTALFKKSIFLQVGGMDIQFGILADVDLWMKIALKYKVGYVSNPLLILMKRQEDDYPKEYTSFSWKRKNWLYCIHNVNYKRFYQSKIPLLVLQFKINYNIFYQILYLIKNKKYHLLLKSNDIKLCKEYYILRILKMLIIRILLR